jgi:acetoin utilization deacetylase AcuC-like enzyme
MPLPVLYHPLCHEHDSGEGHPECQARYAVVKEALEKAHFADRLHWHSPPPARPEHIHAVHSPEYRQYVEEACLQGRSILDFGETHIGHESYEAAMAAAGCAIAAVDSVLREGYPRSFALARPPGHHAGIEKAMGFCIFNNVAIAARYAEETYGVERVAILDWDVHHGNGTQDVFDNSPSVLFCSIHQWPLYPGSGDFHEIGSGPGSGLTINCPLPPHSELDHYLEVMAKEVEPALQEFKPGLLLLSAGFDAHRDDPLADMRLDSTAYYKLTEVTCELAQRTANNRLVSLLEGGYNLEALAASVTQHVQALLDH